MKRWGAVLATLVSALAAATVGVPSRRARTISASDSGDGACQS